MTLNSGSTCLYLYLLSAGIIDKHGHAWFMGVGIRAQGLMHARQVHYQLNHTSKGLIALAGFV